MKKICFLLWAICIPMLIQGCGQGQSGPSQKKVKLGFVCNNASDFWARVRRGCDFAAQNVGNVEVYFHTLSDSTVAAQQQIVSNLVASGVDGVAISPIDADSQTEFLNSVAAKTLLVCMDSDAEGSKRVSFIGTDNVTAGKRAAELLETALPEGGKVALFVGYTSAQNARDRIEGLQAGLNGSNIEIVDTFVDESKSALAEKNPLDALAKYPDLAGMVGLWSYNGLAIVKALRSAGKTGQVKIVCFDDDKDTLAGIVNGEIYGTIVQRPYYIGSVTTSRMAQYLRGDKTQLAGEKVFFPANVITKDNIAAFKDALARRPEF